MKGFQNKSNAQLIPQKIRKPVLQAYPKDKSTEIRKS